MSNNEQLGYGLKDGVLVHVRDVVRGLECNCVCVKCKNPLIAKKGSQRIHHFAHVGEVKCEGAAETALHHFAKLIFGEIGRIRLPKYVFSRSKKTKGEVLVQHIAKVARGGDWNFERVDTEKRVGDVIPDILLYGGARRLIIEIAVFHKVDCVKLRRLRALDTPSIEIRLSPEDSLLEPESLRRRIVDEIELKHWLFHPLQREAERAFYEKYRLVLREGRQRKRTMRTLVWERIKSEISRPRKSIAVPMAPSQKEYDKKAREFYSRNGRYPLMEECLRLWPHLYKK
jgi:hypothetical protein